MQKGNLENFKTESVKQKYYDSLAEVEDFRVKYEIEVKRFVPGYKEEMLPIIISSLKTISRNGRTIDLGCGPGNLSAEIFKAIHPKEMIWIDENPAMVEVAKQTAKIEGVSPSIVNESIESFSAEGEFHAVHSSLTFHNIPHTAKELAVKKVFNILKSRGIFIWTDLIYFEDKEKQKKEVNYRKQYALDRGANPTFVESSFKKEAENDYPLTVEKTEEMLIKIGFVDIQRIWQSTTFLTVSAKKP